MQIYLLRHGIAEEGRPGQPDRERAITDVGWQRLRAAAPTWRRLCDRPQVVLASPLRRAQETASVLCDALGHRGEIRTAPELVPEAEPSRALSLLEIEQLSGTACVAIVGHEPHLGYLLGTLLTGQPRLSVPFRKGMLVGVETESTASLVATLRFAIGQRNAGELA